MTACPTVTSHIFASYRRRHDASGMRSLPPAGPMARRLLARAGCSGVVYRMGHDTDARLVADDLGQAVSKYIGEAEKNLNRVFAIAEPGMPGLVFDESDDLIGRGA